MLQHFHDAITHPNSDRDEDYGDPCKFCKEPEYMAWEHQKIRKDGFSLDGPAFSHHKINQYAFYRRITCPLCNKEQQ
jgi:hypothetical protein